MYLQKRAMHAPKLAEWVQRLHHAGSLGPPTTCPSGQRHDRDRSRREGGAADLAKVRIETVAAVHHIAGLNIFDDRVGGKSILGQTDQSALEAGANVFVLLRIEAISLEQLVKIAATGLVLPGPGE